MGVVGQRIYVYVHFKFTCAKAVCIPFSDCTRHVNMPAQNHQDWLHSLWRSLSTYYDNDMPHFFQSGSCNYPNIPQTILKYQCHRHNHYLKNHSRSTPPTNGWICVDLLTAQFCPTKPAKAWLKAFGETSVTLGSSTPGAWGHGTLIQVGWRMEIRRIHYTLKSLFIWYGQRMARNWNPHH